MKKILFILLLALVSIVSNPLKSKASHISGGDISFQCVGPNTYQVTLNLFRDCDGITMSNSEFINATSTCGGSVSITLNLANPGGTNISQLCPVDSLNGTCFPGGFLPGMQLYTYTATVVLAPPCDTWTLGWSTCCRNNTVNVPSSSSDNIYIEATLNTLTAPCNNSPVFTSQPIPYVCANQPVNYNYGVSEPDGDSLAFIFVSAWDAQGTALTYAGGYSGNAPINGITINPVTGQISFLPTVLGNFIVVVQCNEYDDNGNLISTTMRDIQFVVLNCNNTVPDINAGQITAMVGNAVVTSPNSVDICEGNTFSFTAVYTDPDVNDSLFLSTNMGIVLPGSSYTLSGSNPLTVVYSWTVPPGSAGTNTTFVVSIEDNACPVTGMQTFVYDINVLDRTLAYPDQTICGAQQAQLNASGGSIFTWKDLSGNLIPVSPQFSCNPCNNPIAAPLNTTTYVVESNLVGSCINSDTVTVTVVPDFTYNITQSQTAACLFQPIQLGVTVNPPGNYSYSWMPANVMSNPNIANPEANFTQSGSHTVYVMIVSPNNCVRFDSLTVNIASNVAPVVTIVSDTVCIGGSNQLMVDFGSTIPVNCGTTTTSCTGPVQTGTIGTGTGSNGGTGFPNVFGNWYWGARHQMLYTAAELAAMGFAGGKISSIGFNLTALNGSTLSYQDFSIKMKCTNLTSLSAFESGMQTVFPAQTVTPVLGWNNFTLSPLYEWDGSSNLIVEVCFNNSSYTNNCSNTFTTTPFTSVVYFYQDASGVCSNAGGFVNTGTDRPNIQLNFCGGVADPNLFTYQWSPANYVSDPTILNPVSTINFDTTFSVIVTAIIGGCADTASLAVFNVPAPGSSAINLPPSTFYCVNDPAVTLTAATTGGTWSGPGIDPVTGLFTPAAATQGNHMITYSIIGSAQCFTSDTIYLDVVNSPNATINYNGANNLCISTTPFTISPVVPGGTWSGPGIVPATGYFDPQMAGAGTHDLIYTLGTGNCIEDDTLTLIITPLPDESLTPVVNLCETDVPVNLVAATPGGVWAGSGVTNGSPATFDPSTSGTGLINVTYTVTDICSFVANMNILVVPPPPQPLIVNNSPICEMVNLEFTTGAVQNATYNWSGPNGFSSTDQNPIIIDATVADSGLYSCVITVNGCNSLSGSSYAYMIPTPPTPNIVANDPICEEGDLILSTDSFPNAIYLWSGPNGFSAATMDVTIPFVTAAASGQYLLVKQANGCSSPQGAANIVVNPKPHADFNPNPATTTIMDPQVWFINTSDLQMVYDWSFGDNTVSSDFEPFHSYADTGSYQVILMVTNPATSCSSSVEKTYIIEPYFSFFIPNAFTPNGDGLNDEFKIVTNSILAYQIHVYDRWGQIIWQSVQPDQTWNGKIGGQDAPQGSYVYHVKVTTNTGEQKKFTGTVDILR